jgi:hypothetical protein
MAGAGFTVSATLDVPAPPALSVTLTVIVKDPAAVGVPESKPVVLNVTPAGNPDVAAQV